MIRIGTSGWRAVIADEFTGANVRFDAPGYLREEDDSPGPDAPMTEPLVRIYAEATREDALEVLLESGRESVSS